MGRKIERARDPDDHRTSQQCQNTHLCCRNGAFHPLEHSCWLRETGNKAVNMQMCSSQVVIKPRNRIEIGGVVLLWKEYR